MLLFCGVEQSFRADFLNAVYFRRGLKCTLGLTNDLIDGSQPRAIYNRLHKAKPKTVFSSWLTKSFSTR